MNLIIQQATDTDLEAIKKLLDNNNLPTTDIQQDNIQFFIGLMDDKIMSVIGLEKYKNVALLRSLAVTDLFKKQQVGTRLIQQIFNLCATEHIDKLYLFTTTAEKYFLKFGFLKIERIEAPDILKQTREFKDICPASAVLMFKKLNQG
jgi:amino-acid N-acetyltransferase